MTAQDEIKKIQRMSIPDRLALAKAKASKIVDHLLYLLELHENNAILLYSPLISGQIPQSHAANAFLVFQRGLHQFEIVRLCALWDGIDLDKENIPTVVALIDDPAAIDHLAKEVAAFWKGQEFAVLDPSPDPEMAEAIAEAHRAAEGDFGRSQGEKARKELRESIDACTEICSSAKLSSIMNLRDKHLAHSLSKTRIEKKAGPVAPMKYGDERELLDRTLPLVEALYRWVGGAGFSFEDSREIDRRNAKALWEACTFNVTY